MLEVSTVVSMELDILALRVACLLCIYFCLTHFIKSILLYHISAMGLVISQCKLPS
jgi:hypothetical protein